MREISPSTQIEITEQRPAERADPSTLTLVVSVEQWGLRRVLPTESGRFAGFIDVKAVAEAGSGRIWDTKQSVLSGDRHSLEAYDDAGLLRRQLEDAATSAGERLATRLVYRTEGKR
jgi:hypothetical protein